MVEFNTHGQSGLLVHTQNTSLALALTCVVVELEPSSLGLPSTNATSIHLHDGVHK